jgi:hypothetical protein
MDETELKKYEYTDHEIISKSDIFLKDHYEELFYMTPKELAVTINSMHEDELIQFNQTIHKGHGMNVCLMRDKLDVLGEYQNLNSIFIEAYYRISIIDAICSLPDFPELSYKEKFHKMFTTLKYLFEDEGREKPLTDNVFRNYLNEHCTPQVIKDLIEAGQLEEKPINGKYKPVFEITDFMIWLDENNYGDYLVFNFFDKFIFYELTKETIKQYLKPSCYGVKKPKKSRKVKKS